jgi:CheY-like chemotaxis protein
VSEPLHVLVVGDSEEERQALRAALEDASVPVTTEAVPSLEEALARIARTDLPAVDAALLDLDAVRRIAIRQEVRETLAPAREQLQEAREIVDQLGAAVPPKSPPPK